MSGVRSWRRGLAPLALGVFLVFGAIVLGAGVPQASWATSKAPAPAAPCTAATLQGAASPATDLLACTTALLDARVPGQAPVSTDVLYAEISAVRMRDVTRPAPADVETAKRVLDELDVRRATRPEERREMLDIFLLNGLLDEATSTKASIGSRRDLVYPVAKPLQGVRPPGQARYWSWDTASNVLAEHAVDLTRGVHVVVISSAGCHFCRDAAIEIRNDPEMGPAFRDHAFWISRPDYGFDRQSFIDWNALHPTTPIAVVFDLQGWPHPEEWSTPWFYFLRDGQVVKTVRGWWKQGTQEAEVRTGLRDLGLLSGAN